MIITKVAIGNNERAFVEDRFVNNMNIISSDDNNKGKTILIQGMMYALGNTPTFPVSFDYKSFYFIVEFKINNKLYKVCRYKDNYIIKFENELRQLENTSEFRRFWDKEISLLPKIVKNNNLVLVHPELFVQLFFVGQDKKNTSTIANPNYYKNDDFYNMLYWICGVKIHIDETELKKQKKQLQDLVHAKKILLRENKILNSKRKEISILSPTNDRIQFENNLDKIEKINQTITELNKERNRNLTRKLKCETAIKEINSLNRELDTGEIVCLNCGSLHIGYKTSSKNEYVFDITTTEIRKEIVQSIQYKIADYQEEIERINIELNNKQILLNELLTVEEVSLEALLFYKDDLLAVKDIDDKIVKLDKEIDGVKSNLSAIEVKKESLELTEKEILEKIYGLMNETYKDIEPNGTLLFTSLFTKKNETYSGSEQTLFYLIKTYVFQKITGHKMPIVVDSFRFEDLSTEKEKAFLDLFNGLGNQIIFSTTLKDEEIGKYDKDEFDFVNHINYSNHISYNLLQTSFVDYFNTLLKEIIE